MLTMPPPSASGSGDTPDLPGRAKEPRPWLRYLVVMFSVAVAVGVLITIMAVTSSASGAGGCGGG
jgi:hypothetical protein